jgi:hypothetical protein
VEERSVARFKRKQDGSVPDYDLMGLLCQELAASIAALPPKNCQLLKTKKTSRDS